MELSEQRSEVLSEEFNALNTRYKQMLSNKSLYEEVVEFVSLQRILFAYAEELHRRGIDVATSG